MRCRPPAAEAQQARAYRVGVILQGGPYFQAVDGLREGLRELGLEEGKQITLYVRDAKGDLKTVEAAARELEQDRVDLIYSVTTSVTLATKRVTKSVPIGSTLAQIRWPWASCKATGSPAEGSRAFMAS